MVFRLYPRLFSPTTFVIQKDEISKVTHGKMNCILKLIQERKYRLDLNDRCETLSILQVSLGDSFFKALLTITVMTKYISQCLHVLFTLHNLHPYIRYKMTQQETCSWCMCPSEQFARQPSRTLTF